MVRYLNMFIVSLFAITGVIMGAQLLHTEHTMRVVAQSRELTAEEKLRRGTAEQQRISRAAYRKALSDIKMKQAADVKAKKEAAKKKAEAKRLKAEKAAKEAARIERERQEKLARERRAELKRQQELTRQQEAARVASTPTPTPSPKKSAAKTYDPPAQTSGGGSPRAYAQAQLSASQFGCLDLLWNKESGWNVYATNPSSGAYGIPQSLPASKMASAGSDYRTNGITQVIWGLGYIRSVYGTPCSAWAHSQAVNWY